MPAPCAAFSMPTRSIRRSIDVIGFHGQTVLHRPEDRLTVQIGDGAEPRATRPASAVVYDLRAADVAAGGQGAPLVPVFHRALAAMLTRPHPIAVLNVGGVANVTFIDGIPDPYACDTGPGNALIDDFMRARTGAIRDENGASRCARPCRRGSGRARAEAFLLRAEAAEIARPQCLPRMGDRARAACARKASRTARRRSPRSPPRRSRPSCRICREAPKSWIVCGGGASNPTLMRMLGERLAPASVETASAAGWNADAIEAQAFAYMAVRSLRGLPITFPTTTGVPKPMTGGVVAEAGAAQKKKMSL